jgi:CheY-like chemotaxis protein
MPLTLKNAVRRLLYVFRRNGNGSGLTHEKKRTMPSTGSHRMPKTVLFVDDEPSILKMRRLVFETLGYSVFTASSGEEALETLELHQVDAVVLDYLMPGMDGEETARRARELRREIPIILSSGCLTVAERVLEIVTASVDKATSPEALIEVLKQHLHPLVDSTPNGIVKLVPV